MKVTHIINNLDIGGGAQTLVKDICLNSKLSHTVVTLEKPSLEYEGLNHLNLLINPIKALKEIYYSDVLHFHLFPTLYLAPLFFFKKKVYTEHNTYNRRRNYKIFKLIDSFFYLFYSKIICISSGTKHALQSWLIGHHLHSKLEIIFNGVDFAIFRNEESNFNNSKDSFINHKPISIGMVGSFTDQKNQKFLIEIMKTLPSNFNLKLAGSGKNLVPLKEYAQKIGVGDKVFFYGLVKDIPSFYKELDLYVHSAHWEGFGLTVIEAIASGLPTFASDVEGLKEIIPKEFLFKSNDSSMLSKLILTTFEKYNQSDLDKLLKESKRSFDISVMVRKYEFIYMSV